MPVLMLAEFDDDTDAIVLNNIAAFIGTHMPTARLYGLRCSQEVVTTVMRAAGLGAQHVSDVTAAEENDYRKAQA